MQAGCPAEYSRGVRRLEVFAGLAGFAGALLALPVAAAAKVAIRDLWWERRRRLAVVSAPGPMPSAEPPPAQAEP